MQRDHRLDLLKWLALACMVLDHLRYVGWSLDLLYIPGRLAFPWFCLAIAANVLRRPGAPITGKYLGLMLLFSLISEIPYRLFVFPAETLNVMPTLALGLLLASAWGQRSRQARAITLGVPLVAALGHDYLMFGLPGVLLPWLCVLVWRRPLYWALLPGVACLAGNAWRQLYEMALYANPAAIGGMGACLLAPLLGLALQRHGPPTPVPALRRWAYAFYPLHFLLLLGLRLVIRAS